MFWDGLGSLLNFSANTFLSHYKQAQLFQICESLRLHTGTVSVRLHVYRTKTS